MASVCGTSGVGLVDRPGTERHSAPYMYRRTPAGATIVLAGLTRVISEVSALANSTPAGARL